MEVSVRDILQIKNNLKRHILKDTLYMYKKLVKNNDINNFFEGNHLYIYLYRKAEKLASALYVVTNLINNKEMLRSLLREKSIDIFSEIMQLQRMSLTNTNAIKKDASTQTKSGYVSLDIVLSNITEIISLLEIANVSGYISEMNFSVLKLEYIDLGALIKTKREDIVSDNIQLPKEFFDVPNLYEMRASKQGSTKKEKDISIKDTNNIQKVFETNIRKHPSVKDNSNFIAKVKDDIHLKTANIRHNNRRNTILELLQDKSFVTVKDVIDAIKGCSSKTLQRELLALVSEGILIKKGERRWSTYSLA